MNSLIFILIMSFPYWYYFITKPSYIQAIYIFLIVNGIKTTVRPAELWIYICLYSIIHIQSLACGHVVGLPCTNYLRYLIFNRIHMIFSPFLPNCQLEDKLQRTCQSLDKNVNVFLSVYQRAWIIFNELGSYRKEIHAKFLAFFW